MRILLAEDEKALAKALVKIFESNNYSIDAVHDGQDALDYLEAGNYDAAVLDIMMPKVDGITVLKKLRESGSDLPVLMLTAKSEIDDKVLGLDSGANYYLTKPFDSKELLAAVRAITRSGNEVDTKMSFGNITLDRASFELSGPAGDVKGVPDDGASDGKAWQHNIGGYFHGSHLGLRQRYREQCRLGVRVVSQKEAHCDRLGCKDKGLAQRGIFACNGIAARGSDPLTK